MLGDHNVRDYGGHWRPGIRRLVARGVLEWLAEDMTPSLELRGIAADGEMRHAFDEVADGLRWTVAAEPEAVAPVAALPAFRRSSGPRQATGTSCGAARNLEAAGTVAFERVSATDDVAVTVDDLMALMRASRADRPPSSRRPWRRSSVTSRPFSSWGWRRSRSCGWKTRRCDAVRVRIRRG
jgi:hypothetical protein